MTRAPMQFDDEDALQQFVAASLKGSGLPLAEIGKSASKLGFDREAIPPPPRPDGLGFIIPRYRWIIRDDDLKLLDAVSEGFKSAGAAGFFFHAVHGGPLASAIGGIVVASVRLVRQARNKGAIVSPAELRILIVLKTNPDGLTPPEVAAILSQSVPTTDADVRQVLNRLAKYAVGDGSTTPFVAEDGDGRWRVNGA